MTEDEPKVFTTRVIVILSSMWVGVFLAALDGTVVTSLLSHIASDLKELQRVQWIATGYLVACAAFQPIYGKISDIYGRKNVLVFCNLMFALGCLICGVAANLEQLVLGRVVAGIGGGGMFSVGTIAQSDLVPLRSRGILQGIGNICYGVGAGVGGVVGGFMSDRYGWRSAFNVQIPFILLSAVLLMVFFTHDNVKKQERAPLLGEESNNGSYGATNSSKKGSRFIDYDQLRRIDFLGSITLVSSLLLLMLAISIGGQQYAWTSPVVIGLLGLSAAIASLFVYVELYIAKEPVIPVNLFSNRTIMASSLTNFFCTMSVYAILFFVPVRFQSVMDMTPTQVGKRLFGNFIGVASGSFMAGFYMKHTGRYYWCGVISPLLYLFGVSILIHYHLTMPLSMQYASLILNGFGYAAMLTVTLLALIAAVPHEFQAVTTSIQYAFRGIGSSLGVSVGSSIFQISLAQQLHERVQGPLAGDVISRVMDSVEAIRKVPEEYQPAVIASYEYSTRMVMTSCLVLGVIGLFFSALMREYKLHNTLERH
ncbi:vacuolar basic amino acid transporter 1 [Trichomonascus vanleenenianus]|uniref:vacuolar basic amino acid transporter 1 n=1 Tax=Trichomonascus vanleenenianus TaxID=2268995 RepID=UPI003ECA7F57